MNTPPEDINPHLISLIHDKISKDIGAWPRFFGNYFQPIFGAQVYQIMLRMSGNDGQRIIRELTNHAMVLLRLPATDDGERAAVVESDGQAGQETRDAASESRSDDAPRLGKGKRK